MEQGSKELINSLLELNTGVLGKFKIVKTVSGIVVELISKIETMVAKLSSHQTELDRALEKVDQLTQKIDQLTVELESLKNNLGQNAAPKSFSKTSQDVMQKLYEQYNDKS